MSEESQERELRIAPVMTGGTSLAIWMGGATAELYRLLRSRRDNVSGDPGTHIYRRLLELTRTVPVVDVITGTSAGGVNGVLLAAAVAGDASSATFLACRDTWLDVADLGGMLRKAKEPNPPSLLLGDDYFLEKLHEKICELAPPGNQRVPPAAAVLDLVTTVTTLTPEPRTRTDDFGEVIAEVDHAQCLQFGPDAFKRDDGSWQRMVAVAARASASIPGVFEPCFLPVGETGPGGRPDFHGIASFRSSRWAVDGGVVVNLPLTEALNRIYERPATGEVRRVIVYVSPTPSAPSAPEADRLDDPPSIGLALTSVATAPRAEGVSSDIDLLRQRNEAVEHQLRARRNLGPVVSALAGRQAIPSPDDWLAAYRRVRAEGPLDATIAWAWRNLGPFVSALAGRRAIPSPDDASFAAYRGVRAQRSVDATIARVRSAAGDRLPVDERKLAAELLEPRTELLPSAIDALGSAGRPWGWGIEPVQQAVSIGLGLLARTQRLVSPGHADEHGWLADAKKKVHAARAIVEDVRRQDDEFWKWRLLTDFPTWWTAVQAGAELRQEGEERQDYLRTSLAEWAKESYRLWPVVPAPAGAAPRRAAAAAAAMVPLDRLRKAHQQVADTLASHGSRFDQALVSAGARSSAFGEAAEEIRRELTILEIPGGDPDRVRDALLRMHVAQTLVLGDVIDREQRVELMQISWNSWNALDGRKPADKLVGPELARLGAFINRSWRANDWLWGRMDAAYRLILLLLDPARLRGLECSSDDVCSLVKELTSQDAVGDDIVDELAFLDHVEEPLPESLPATAQALAGVAQREIGRVELRVVADAVYRARRDGANEVDGGAFRRAVESVLRDNGDQIPPDRVEALMGRLKIGTEGVGGQLGYESLNRVMSRGASVTVNGLTGTSAGVPVVGRVLRPLRVPLQGVNSVTSLLTGGSLLARGLTALVLALAGALVGLRIAGGEVPEGTFVIAATLLVATFAAAMVRSGFAWLATLFVAGAAVVGLALSGPDLRDVVYSTAEATSETPLPPGTEIEVGDSGLLRVTAGSGTDEVTDDLVLDDGGVVTVRSDGVAVRATERTGEVADWKRWGFINRISVFTTVGVMVLAVPVVAVIRNAVVRRRGTGRAARPWKTPRVRGWVAWALFLVVVVWAPTIFDALLTGTAPATDARPSPPPFKLRVVELAEALHDYQLEVVLLTLTVAGVLLALGIDLVAGRVGRTVKALWVGWHGRDGRPGRARPGAGSPT